MKKTPMGFDEQGNSIWIDNPVVTIPDEFTLNVAGQSVNFTRAMEDAYLGAEVGYKSQGGKMWEGYVGEGYDDYDLMFLAVNPDGQFEGMVQITRDGGEEDNNTDFVGKNPNMDSILSNFERYLNDVYPSLASKYPLNKSTKKSQKATKMAKQQAIKKENYSELISTLNSMYDDVDEMQSKVNDLENEYPQFQNQLEDLYQAFNEVTTEFSFGLLHDLENGEYSASTKKSKYARLHKALNKLGGFTKEDDEKEIEIEDDDVVEIEDDEDGEGKVVEIESEETHDEEVADGEESESDNLNESCKDAKSKKSFRTSKKRMKMRKAEEMPEDADDQQDINQKGSGNAGSELPEDADEVTEINQKGSGNAGSDLPEDADDAEDQKQARARKQRMMRSSNKGMRKFSVTPGGQPNQESYAQRYSQAPMVREAINRHFGDSANKSFDDIQMLQDRIDAMNKSRRNTESNNVPMKLRRR